MEDKHQFDSGNHSVFEMHYHLILVIKYRRKVINNAVSEHLREIFEYIAPRYGIRVEAWNHDIDHVHVLFTGKPNSDLSGFINSYKSASSRIIKRAFPNIRNYLWKDAFWSRSYCIVTTGGVTADIIERYISSQGKKHGEQSDQVQSISYK